MFNSLLFKKPQLNLLKVTTLFFFIQLFCISAFNGQLSYTHTNFSAFDTDSISLDSAITLHSPKKAALLSAIIPGLGQAYNKKYWKTPIAIGGLAVCGYFLNDNLKALKRYKQSYLAEIDGDSTTINSSGFDGGQLDELINIRKNWRDWSYISLGAVYILNVLDAYVDGHLYHFDVGEDITLHVRPSFDYATKPIAGVSLALKF